MKLQGLEQCPCGVLDCHVDPELKCSDSNDEYFSIGAIKKDHLKQTMFNQDEDLSLNYSFQYEGHTSTFPGVLCNIY